MSRFRPLSVPFASGVVAALLLAVALPGCSDDPDRRGVAPFAGAGPETPSSVSAPESTPGGDLELAFVDALAAAFDRPAGALDRQTSVTYAGIGARQFVELRWNNHRGTLRSWVEVDETMLQYPEGRDAAAQFAREELDIELEGDQLRRALADARSSVAALVADVDLRDDGMGWWRGRGESLGPIRVDVHVTDGMADHVERTVSGLAFSAADIWQVVG